MEQLAEIWNPHLRQRTLPDHRNGNPRRPRAAKRNLDRRRDFYSALGREALRPSSRAFQFGGPLSADWVTGRPR